MLTIGVLTGLRPELLAATLEAFSSKQPDLWQEATRVVVHNTGDRATQEVLDEFDWDDRLTLHGELRSIAEASQHLLALADDAGEEYFLRLEDDWEATGAAWWDDAVDLLKTSGQVRLRRSDEKVLADHRITKKPIVWKVQQGGHLWSRSAHYTHNPSLMRTDDAVSLSGYADEIDAARRYLDAGWASSQLVPGVFRHLGHRTQGLSLKWAQ